MARGRVHGGDGGETGLPGGRRVAKSHARIVALGEIDELCALLGAIVAQLSSGDGGDAASLLTTVQRDLLVLGGRLAEGDAPPVRSAAKLVWGPERLRNLEGAIDERGARLEPLSTFILPGGSRAGSWLHVARAVCRRAERALVSLGESESVEAPLIAYLNRLSMLLFVLARDVNERQGRREEAW